MSDVLPPIADDEIIELPVSANLERVVRVLGRLSPEGLRADFPYLEEVWQRLRTAAPAVLSVPASMTFDLVVAPGSSQQCTLASYSPGSLSLGGTRSPVCEMAYRVLDGDTYILGRTRPSPAEPSVVYLAGCADGSPLLALSHAMATARVSRVQLALERVGERLSIENVGKNPIRIVAR
jgi:hypothetical protein